MHETRAASRYAKALLELAQEKGVLERVHEDMLFFKKVCDENRELFLMLQSPVVHHYKKYAVLQQIFELRVHPVTFSIFKIITEKNRESILYDIAREFHQQYNRFKNIQTAYVTTTFPLDEKLRAHFIRVTQEATGKTIELEERIDPNLIGGFILRVGDKQIDDSIQSKLLNLQQAFSLS